MAISNMFGATVPFFAMQTAKAASVKTPKEMKILKKAFGGIIEEAEKAGAPEAVVSFMNAIDLDQTYLDFRSAFKKNGISGKAILKAARKSKQFGWLVTLAVIFAGPKLETAIDDKITTMPPEKMEELKKFFDL